MERMKPKVPEIPIDLRKLFACCGGRGFEDRRDCAILRLFADTGIRRSELAALTVDDVDLDLGVVYVVGRRPRSAPFGKRTAQSLERYLRARARHKDAAMTGALWLGIKGAMTNSGVQRVVRERGRAAGIERAAPAPAASLVCSQVAGSRRAGGRLDAPRRVAIAPDALPLRGQR